MSGPDTTFLTSGNDRLPDVSFVSMDRLPADGESEGKWPFAPDPAGEIVSPNDFYEKGIEKTEEYLSAGVREVWLALPQSAPPASPRSALTWMCGRPDDVSKFSHCPSDFR